MTAAATVVSACALDVVATTTGALLAATSWFDDTAWGAVAGFLAATYVLWIAGLRANVAANWRLLEQAGISTNLPSKLLFELARRRSSGQSLSRAASAVGYIATEIAKEAPYYAGAFGTAALTEQITSTDALVFIAGTNLGAAAYEYGIARLSRCYLDRRARRIADLT